MSANTMENTLEMPQHTMKINVNKNVKITVFPIADTGALTDPKNNVHYGSYPLAIA